MPGLPKLKPDPMIEGNLIGKFRTFTGPVEISVSEKAAGCDSGMELVRSSRAHVDLLERRAKSAAARDLLQVYDESWRVYETFEDGILKTAEGPSLNESSFGNMLRLSRLEISDPNTLCLWFETNDIFGGHNIIVTFRDGVEGSCKAQLWG